MGATQYVGLVIADGKFIVHQTTGRDEGHARARCDKIAELMKPEHEKLEVEIMTREEWTGGKGQKLRKKCQVAEAKE